MATSLERLDAQGEQEAVAQAVLLQDVKEKQNLKDGVDPLDLCMNPLTMLSGVFSDIINTQAKAQATQASAMETNQHYLMDLKDVYKEAADKAHEAGKSGGMSTGAKIGIIIGVTVGCLLAGAVGSYFAGLALSTAATATIATTTTAAMVTTTGLSMADAARQGDIGAGMQEQAANMASANTVGGALQSKTQQNADDAKTASTVIQTTAQMWSAIIAAAERSNTVKA